MVKLISGIALVALLAACANSQVREYSDWVQKAKNRAEHGELKWSEYYQGCFSRLAETPNGVEGKSTDLEYYNTMIGYALDYESGRMTISAFEEKRRLALIAKAKNREARVSARPGAGEAVKLHTTY